MNKKTEIVGFMGGTEDDLAFYLSGKEKEFTKIVDFNQTINDLIEPGEEGYRQIINYFGEEFLKADLRINTRKLWRFIGVDIHKKRIFHLLMEPIFFNYLQTLSDAKMDMKIMVILPELQNKKYEQRFKTIVRA
jgi:dephospho-CoA kinase